MELSQEDDNCSFHSTEMNNQIETNELSKIDENEIGEWEILFRLESVEDLEKLFSPNKKINENLGDKTK